MDGLTGSEISRLNLEAEIEASPAAYNNVVVIGTTGKGTSFVYGIEVKLESTQEDAGVAEQTQDGGEEPEEPENAEEGPDWPDEEGGGEDEEDSGGA